MNHRLCLGLLLCLACGAERDWEDRDQADQCSTGEGDSPPGGESSEGGELHADGTSGAGTSGGTTTGTTATIDPIDASPASTTGTTGTSDTSDTSDGSSTGDDSVCGDGIVQDGEECDDPGDLHCFNCYRDRRVFITSLDFQGDWALDGIDYWCNHLAAEAGLIPGGESHFKPWVSNSLGSAGERLHHSPGRYVLVNDFVFAESWDDIIAGNILHPLFVDEHGEERDDLVWTDTAPDGSALLAAGGDHCNDWEDDSPESLAHYGYSWEVDGDWTRFDDDPGFNPISCDTWGALYCFESP